MSTPDKIPSFVASYEEAVKQAEPTPKETPKPHRFDVIDGAIVGFFAARATEGQKTFFSKATYAGLGAICALAGLHIGHWISGKIFGPDKGHEK